MTEQRRRGRRSLLRGAGAAGVAALAGCLGGGAGPGLRVLHAGSLAPAFATVADGFEERDVSVAREARGSVATTKKVTQLGRRADVLAVADHRLLRDRVLPEHAAWYVAFATNAMGILYTEESRGVADLSRDSWWEVLARDDVRVGHSDPAIDPGGYRAQMVFDLGALPFDGETLYDRDTARHLRENAVVLGEETTLVSHLAAGELDYVVFYRSAAADGDVQFLGLQDRVDLSRFDPRYARHYARASVETESGTFTASPIVYAATVPDDAPSPDRGARWVAHLLGDAGRETLEAHGLGTLDAGVVPARTADAVPAPVAERARTAEQVGPVQL
jgi:molybdate/tungstate transport system substrate-binding protein